MAKNKAGLTILVQGADWIALGEPTIRNKMLYTYLQRRGGINESVPEGVHIYNIRREGLNLVESLLPAE